LHLYNNTSFDFDSNSKDKSYFLLPPKKSSTKALVESSSPFKSSASPVKKEHPLAAYAQAITLKALEYLVYYIESLIKIGCS